MSTPPVAYVAFEGDATDAMLFGTLWESGEGAALLTYSFPDEGSTWDDGAYGTPGEPTVGFLPFSLTEREAVQDALFAWSTVAQVSFTAVPDQDASSGALRFAYTGWEMDPGLLAYAYVPNESENGGDVWLNADLRDGLFASFDPGTLGYFVLLHEIGHALGLKHPHEPSMFSWATLEANDDSVFNTVMSYHAAPGILLTGTNIDRLPTTPMSLDIDALQALYGANPHARSGDDHYLFSSDGRYLETIFDTGGNDTIELTGSAGSEIDLRPGEWSRLGLPVIIDGVAPIPDTVRIYRTSQLENAIGGAGDDSLIGNDADNRLAGNAGNDLLTGGPGNDTLAGGAGSDTASYHDAPGSVRADLFDGRARGAAGNDGLDGVENVWGSDRFNDIVRGNAQGNALSGNGGDDLLEGRGGNDTLIGGPGSDRMLGGPGDDRYEVDSRLDRVVEAAAAGNDVVYAAVDYRLPANVEQLVIDSAGNIGAWGNALANVIHPGAGNNWIDGGPGSDTVDYSTSAAGVQVSLAVHAPQATAGSGVDTLRSVENLIGTESGDRLAGNSAGNKLSGLAGNDTVAGGAGSDILYGGAGADRFDFSTPLDARSNVDWIKDFDVDEDTLALDNDIFTAFTTENVALAPAAFYGGAGVSAAHDVDDRILYDASSGRLYYDPDGIGFSASIPFATLAGAPALTAADLLVIG